MSERRDVSSAKRGAALTPGSTVLEPTRALWVGAAGDITVKMADDASTVTLAGVPAGTLLPISVIQVTVAAGGSVVALY